MGTFKDFLDERRQERGGLVEVDGGEGAMAVDAPDAPAPSDPEPDPDTAWKAQPFSALIGPAGTGKTFFTKGWAAQEKRGSVVLAATTGIAAINLGEGTTINSLLGFFDTASLRDAYVSGFLASRLSKLHKAGLRRICLDEVSMLDGEQLTILTRVLDELAGYGYGIGVDVDTDYDADATPEESDPEYPVKLTLIGDFCQLPPVKAPFAFESPEWERYAPYTKVLTEIRRQADKDYIEALMAVRRGDAAMALEYFGDRLEPLTDHHFDGPTLLARNEEVDRFNRLRMDALPTPKVSFTATRWGKQRGEWKLIPDTLLLKEGALVMILANAKDTLSEDPHKFLYVNGDLGDLQSAEGDVAYVKLRRTGEVVRVPKVTREVKIPLEVGRAKALKAEGHGDRIDGKWEITGAVTYMPLRLAYATTVHKCVAADTRVPVHGRGYVEIDTLSTDATTPYGPVLNRVRTIRSAYRVTTKRGYTVTCSADHRWLTRDGWIETKDLIHRDIELNPGPPFPGDDSLGPTKAWVLGAIVGDGCYTDLDDGTIHFACAHQVFGGMFEQALKEAFDITPSWRSDRRGLHWTRKGHRQELLRWGLEYVKAPCKTVPKIVWQLGPRDRGAFLQGLFDTDGHLGRSRIVLTTASETLGREVQELLLTLGIISKRTSYPGVKESIYWQVFIGAESLDRFQQLVGFRHPEKRQKLYARPNRVLRPTNGYDRVVSVQPLGIEIPMVDIELPTPHTISFGPFMGHNSQGLSLDQVQVNIRDHFFSTPGMLYVALSRARTAEGLRLVGQPGTFQARCTVDERVRPWL